MPPALSRGLVAGAAALLPLEALNAQEREEESELEVEATYTVDLLSNLDGGIRRDARLMGMAELTADLDGAAIGLLNTAFHVNLEYIHGGGFSERVAGDAQVLSNIDAPRGLRLFEAYAAQAFGKDLQGTVKAGLIDLNGDFDVQKVGAFFLHSSHGVGPEFSQSGQNGPSIFPTTASAVTVQWQGAGWAARLGLFDAVAGDPDRPRRTVVRFPGETGLLIVGEGEAAFGTGTRVLVGAWTYTTRFEAVEPPLRQAGNRGAYALIETRLAPGFDGWVRVGTARAAVNPVQNYLGGGLTYGDDGRKLGFAVAHARLGDPARRAGLATGALLNRAETAFELSYAHRFSDRLTIQPDIQYIINPGWDRTRGNALVIGARVQFTVF
jgi:porin